MTPSYVVRDGYGELKEAMDHIERFVERNYWERNFTVVSRSFLTTLRPYA